MFAFGRMVVEVLELLVSVQQLLPHAMPQRRRPPILLLIVLLPVLLAPVLLVMPLGI